LQAGDPEVIENGVDPAGGDLADRGGHVGVVVDGGHAEAAQDVVMARRGGLSLNPSARQMRISGPALYRYFRNRDVLYAAETEAAIGAL
jgi:hypothetical protein